MLRVFCFECELTHDEISEVVKLLNLTVKKKKKKINMLMVLNVLVPE
jgi:hypothetical protein